MYGFLPKLREHTTIEREQEIVETTQNITFSDDNDVNVEDPITSEFMDRCYEAMITITITITSLTIGNLQGDPKVLQQS